MVAASPARPSVPGRRTLHLALGALALGAGCGEASGSGSSDAAGPGASNAQVERVVDGDTIDVAIGGASERVRLIGIDTPEVARADRDAECFGDEATGFTQDLLPAGTPVRIERDIVSRDDYGRLLGYVHSADGTFVNLEIVRRGYATPLTIEPNSAHAAELAAAATAAERDDLGLWAACAG